MCDFLSFIILKDNGLKILAVDLRSHSVIEKKFGLTPTQTYYEAEWTGEKADSLEIRFPDLTNDATKEHVRNWL